MKIKIKKKTPLFISGYDMIKILSIKSPIQCWTQMVKLGRKNS